MATSYGFAGPRIVRDGLVLYLDAANPNSYNLSTPLTWRDLSKNKNNGTLVNGTTVVSTTAGNVMSFDGVDDRITLPSVASNTSFTVDIWMYPLSGSDDYSALLVQNQSLGIFYRGLSRKISYWYSGGDHLTTQTLTLSTWNNVVVLNNNGSLSYYINGVLDASTFSGALSFLYTIIGDDPSSETYKGSISTVKAYNRALSQAEITQNYNATKGRFGL